MLESYNSNYELEYEKISPEDQKKRGILGRLIGVIADFKNATRNDRQYTEKLWDKAFEDPIIKEKLENRCFFGELGHPAERQEVDPEKIAICLAEKPKKGKDGKLHGVFDILDTPCGRILKTLCDYGCRIGVSTRGTGDVVEGYGGKSQVDPETFDLECWDAVLIPAVKDARLSLVTESFNRNKLKSALKEELNKSTADNRKVMQDTLNNLNISLEDSEDNIDATQSSKKEVDNNESTIVAELQEVLNKNVKYEKQIKELQEKLAVSYTEVSTLKNKESKFNDGIQKYTEASRKIPALEKRISNLTEAITTKDELIQEYRNQMDLLNEKLKRANESKRLLSESVNTGKNNNEQNEKKITDLKEELVKQEKSFNDERIKLQEEINSLKTESKVKNEEYKKHLQKANDTADKYRKGIKEALNRYIYSQSTRYGINKQEVINKLPENYSFDDIDTICEELSNYSLNISKLPFSVSKPTKMKITESKASPLLGYTNDGDEIDDDLINLVKSKVRKNN